MAVGAIAGAIVATSTAWAVLGWPVPAMQQWTLAQVEQLRKDIYDQRSVVFDIRRGQINRDIIELERKEKKRNTDEEYRLRALKEDLRRLDVMMDSMKK